MEMFSPDKKTKTTLALVFLLFLSAISILMYRIYSSQESRSALPLQDGSVSGGETLDRLYSNSPEFIDARKAETDGRSAEAFNLYEQALEDALTPLEEAHIKYRMARSIWDLDLERSIGLFKEIVADESYPNEQKTYAAMWLPMLMSWVNNPKVEDIVFSGDPYTSFRAESFLTKIKNLYEYSLTFGPNGMGEFVLARWYATEIAENDSLSQETLELYRQMTRDYLADGEQYLETNIAHPVNELHIPRVMRERARAIVAFARTGDAQSLAQYDLAFVEAIESGLLSKLDGAVRFDYFVGAYLVEGVDSFTKTSPHLEVLLSNPSEYSGMYRALKAERNNRTGLKMVLVEIANKHEMFKTLLLQKAGWSESDFTL